MFGRKMISLAALVLALSCWGCSSNFDNTDSPTPVANDNASYLGAANCVGCHQSYDWSAGDVSGFLAGKHVIHSTDVNADSGECLNCHDPLGDGPNLEQYIDSSDIPLEGLAAVGCENCHGAGGDHAGGTLSVQYVSPDYTRCGLCHNANADADHHEYHPEADSILEKVTASKHFTGMQRTEVICSKCHSDEGGREYGSVTGNPAELEAAIPESTEPLAEASPIQCRTCHNAHGLSLRLSADQNVTGSAEFNTCTTCHQTSEAYHGETSTAGLSSDRVFYDTHFDLPNTTDADGIVIEGYNLGPIDENGNFGVASERICRDCHDVHAADTTIHKQWANSGHAGYISQVKAAAIAAGSANDALTAAVSRTTGTPWVYYDWDHTYKADGNGDGVSDDDRAGCQRCHTATGAKNYLEAMATINDADPSNDITYDPVNNNFSHLSGWQFVDPSTGLETTPSTQNEMLYCWGCHANNSGELRDPGPVIADYAQGDPAAKVVYPDASGSNVCITCHAGRETGESIAILTTDYTNASFVSPHYFAAAGILFAESGYHFTGRDYTNNAVNSDGPAHEHTTLGMGTTGVAEIDSQFTSGPCVTCHFNSNDGSHTLSPFTTYSATDLSLNPVCVNCHDQRGKGTNSANTWLGRADSSGEYPAGTHLAGYWASIEALEILLDTAGHAYSDAYPYFTPGDWTSIATAAGAVSGKDTLGAAFNFVLLHSDPGGVAHNRRYTRRLLYDSMDFLDNGVLDYSVQTTINAMTITTDFTADNRADAISYLIDNDDAIGTSDERY